MALATSSVEALPPSPRRVRVAAATGHVVGAHADVKLLAEVLPSRLTHPRQRQLQPICWNLPREDVTGLPRFYASSGRQKSCECRSQNGSPVFLESAAP